MTNKKEVSILLLGIVAILAIVGLVLMFTSPVATGNAWFPPPLGPQVQTPAGPQVIPTQDAGYLPLCPNGQKRSRQQGNIPYEAIPGHYCLWYVCPGLQGVNTPGNEPIVGCVKR